MDQWAFRDLRWARDEPFWEGLPFSTPTPPPVGAIGIIDLGEFRDLIYGLQSLRGKILSRKELQSEIESRGLRQYRGREFLSQGWMNMNAVLFCAKREGQGFGL